MNRSQGSLVRRTPIRRSWAALFVAVALCAAASGVAEAATAPPKESAQRPSAQAAVDINTADAAALTAVPGIGKATAQRIVEFRNAHGRFERVDDLLKVKGIGERSLKKLRPHLKVGKKG